MKAIVVPILILLMATQAFSKWVLLLEFRLNRDYIAANLCENKAKPEMACGGQCQLKKRMAAEENESSTKPQTGKTKFQEVPFPFDKKVEPVVLTTLSTAFVETPYLLKKYNAPAPAIFHPPA